MWLCVTWSIDNNVSNERISFLFIVGSLHYLHCWTLKVMAPHSNKMSVTFYQSTRCNIPEYLIV